MSKTLLLVEDIESARKFYCQEFEAKGWVVYQAAHPEEAWGQLKGFLAEQKQLDLIVVDLGLPPAHNDPTIGIKLIESLRAAEEWQLRSVPILAYTALLHKGTQDIIVRRLLALNTSCVLTRVDIHITLSDFLDLVAHHYIVISPPISGEMDKVIPIKPDPLEARDWKILALYAQGKSDREIAPLVKLKPETLSTIRREIHTKLWEAGELEEHENLKEYLTRWYTEHRVRYCRE
jgi:DNA-binding NarL/FixJ family response regulator